MLIVLMIIAAFGSMAVCHHLAKKRGASPVFWGAMGAFFGPFAIPFAYRAKPDPRYNISNRNQ